MRSILMVAAGLLIANAAAQARSPEVSDASFKGSNLAPLASVKLAEAKAIALKARPGKVTDQELERETGGSGLRYSFDIKSRGKAYEVGIDAKTGAILENAAEGKSPD